MTYCTSCGKALDEGARFCSGCGTTVSGQSTSSSGAVAAPPSVTHVVVVKPKNGGLLALKGLLAAIILAVIFGIATRSDNTAHAFSMVIAFGIGAAYIISNLRLWKRNSNVVQGAGIGWAVALFLLLGCLGGLMNMGSSGSSGSRGSAGSASLETPKIMQASDASDLLISRCGKPSLDDSTAYDNPRPPFPTRTIEYKAKQLRFLFIADVAKVGDQPPYRWKLFGITDMTARNPSQARVVSPEEVATRMPCWTGK